MMVATSGSTMGFPKATFQALAERIKAQEGSRSTSYAPDR